MSIRLQIRDAVIAALNTANKPPDVPEVTKNSYQTTSGNGPAMAVRLSNDEPFARTNRAAAVTRREMTIGIECKWYADVPELTDDVLEPLIAWAMAALGDTNLGGLALSVEESGIGEPETIQADHVYVRSIVRFKIEYQHKRNDLTRKQ